MNELAEIRREPAEETEREEKEAMKGEPLYAELLHPRAIGSSPPVLATWYIRSQIGQLSLSPPSYFLCHVILNQGGSRGISLVQERKTLLREKRTRTCSIHSGE